MRLGVLGGTFDPIHRGHLAAAHAAMECAALDRLVLVPTGRPPHRHGAVANAEQRLEMSRLAVAGDPRFAVSDVETRREGLSYTADTLEELKREHPSDELYLVLGWDAARMFATWHQPDKVRRLASVVVVTRPGSTTPDAAALNASGLDPATTVLCERPTPDISGSALRRAIAAGESVGDRLPEAVEQYIAKNRLYMEEADEGRSPQPTPHNR